MAYRNNPQFKAAQEMHREMVNDDQNRAELFAGRRDEGTSGGGGSADEPTIDQLVKKAVNTHADTTTTANRALKVLEQTKQVQEQTMVELSNQRKQIGGLNDKLTQVNQDLTYSERLLRYMRRCCCCWMCDSCTGADPEQQIKRKWEKTVDKGLTSRLDKPEISAGGAKSATNGKSRTQGKTNGTEADTPPQSQYRDPDIRLGPDHQTTETRLHTETRKQNELLDQIHVGLGQLLDNARNIGDELTDQTKQADRLYDRVENTKGRIENVNTRSQLREFKIKDKR